MKNRQFLMLGSLMGLCLAALVLWNLCPNALSAPETSTVVYNYSAKETSFDRKSGITILKGEAKIRNNGDYLNADQITMYKDVKTGELVKIEAVGNVDMSEKGMKATCKHAIFFETEERIELEGADDAPAIVDDGKNRMEAPAITYFRKEDRIEARGKVSGHVTVESREKESEKTEDKTEKVNNEEETKKEPK